MVRTSVLLLGCLAAAVFAGGCSSATPGGPPDGGGAVDSGGAADSGSRDAGLADSGSDAGASDAGGCGANGQPCCAGLCSTGCCNGSLTQCVSVGADCQPGQVCEALNSCAACGGAYQVPCSGGVCVAGGCLDAAVGVCIPDGDDASPDGGTPRLCLAGALVSCGSVNEPCCDNTSCDGGCCSGLGVCVAAGGSCDFQGRTCTGSGSCDAGGIGGECGALGEGCCNALAGNSPFCTSSGLACAPGPNNSTRCQACGDAGQPCCMESQCFSGGCCDVPTRVCIASGAACPGNSDAGGGICSNGGCTGLPLGLPDCGKAGQDSCMGGALCTAPNSVPVGVTCKPCGGLNQGCCIGLLSEDYCPPPYACSAGICVPCGGSGEPCCNGFSCVSGACMNNSVCP